MLKIILQILAVGFGIYTAFSHKKKNVLIATFIYNALNLACIFIIKDFSTLYSSILINVRSVLFLFQDKIKIHKNANTLPWIIVLCHIAIGVANVQNWYQILSVIAPILITLALWFETNRQRLRAEQMSSEVIWLTYNACVGLYLLCIVRFLIIVSLTTAMIKNKNAKKDS